MFYDSNNKYDAVNVFSLWLRKMRDKSQIHFKWNHTAVIRKVDLVLVFGTYI